MSLRKQLLNLRDLFAAAAQRVYDDWDPDDEFCEYGEGGICDSVASALAEVASVTPNVQIADGGQDGDDHAFIVVYNDREAYAVDIPPGVYERGGGYRWVKIPGVVIQASDVTIDEVPREYLDF